MKITAILFIIITILLVRTITAQTIPNDNFETWINHGQYEDPQYWDTPNQEICFFPFYTKVVTKSSDHHSGSFSAKLETKEIPIVYITIPGVITLGTITINIADSTYSITGGVPINDAPTHLKGFYKYQPKGGDSCVIGIMLTKWAGSTRDTIGLGYFSTHDTVSSWAPFSAWIDYSTVTTPDTMNILAISSASFFPTAGTILYLDDLYLDYTTGVKEEDPFAGIDLYQDTELKELRVFFNFPSPRSTSLRLYDMIGREVMEDPSRMIVNDQVKLNYNGFNPGMYILEIVHGNQRYLKKFLFK